jgi:hypothetical protein
MSENIHQAINAVMNEVGYVKKIRSAGVNYSFAGEAALIAAIRPSMVENGIYMHVLKIDNVTREAITTAKGSQMTNTLITATIRFTHAPSGTYIDSASTGEGFDSGDKSANKAMTGLYKYAMRQTFCIETGDDPDKYPSEERKATETATKVIPPALNLERAELVKEQSRIFGALKNKAGSLTINGSSTVEQIQKAIAHNQKLLEAQNEAA